MTKCSDNGHLDYGTHKLCGSADSFTLISYTIDFLIGNYDLEYIEYYEHLKWTKPQRIG